MLDALAMPALEGHSSTVMSNNFLVVYGGKSSPRTLNGDAFALELHSGTWKRLLVAGEAPLPRAYHSAVRYGSKLFVFGGLLSVGVDDVHYNNYNMVANVDALPPNVTSLPPEQRVQDQSSIRYVTQQRLESNSLYCLDVHERCSWSPVTTHGLVPPTRSHHAATVYLQCMYVFGGYSCHTMGRTTDEEYKSLNQVHQLNLETRVWTALEFPSLTPPRLYGMTAASFGPFWLLQGGTNSGNASETNDTWIFHMESLSWRRLGQTVVPPMTFSASSVLGDTLYLVGGCSDKAARFHRQMYCFDLVKGYWWRKVIPENEGPPPHCKSTLSVVGRDLYCIGGLLTNFRRTDSVFRFDTVESIWHEVPTRFDTELLDNVLGLESQVRRGAVPLLMGGATRAVHISQGCQTHDLADEPFASPNSSTRKHVANGNVNLLDPALAFSAHGVGSQPPTNTGLLRAADVWGDAARNAELFSLSKSLVETRTNALQHLDQAVGTSTSTAVGQAHSSQQSAYMGNLRGDGGAGPVQSELAARLQRLKDLSGSLSAAPIATAAATPSQYGGDALQRQLQVHAYWERELGQLAVEHERWRESTLVERDRIVRAVAAMDELPLPSNLTKRSFGDDFAEGSPVKGSGSGLGARGERLRVDPLLRAGYVSPSISKLGLVDELMKRRNK